MNILILSPFFPYPLSQGGKIRIFNIVKYLSRTHKVTLVCLSREKVVDYGPLADFCEEIIVTERSPDLLRDLPVFLLSNIPLNQRRFSSQPFRRILNDLARRRSFDLVQVELSLMWQYQDIFKDIPVVLSTQNIEHEIIRQLRNTSANPLKRFLYALEEKKLKELEEQAWRDCNLCFTVSDMERNAIISVLGHTSKVFTVPNGVDLERFQFLPKSGTDKHVLLIGGMDYLPNLDSVNYFLKELFPVISSEIPDVQLDVVGKALRRIYRRDSLKRITFHESVLDVLPHFRRADLLVVPLRYGAGTRIKILEAMASGLPVVTTSKGCEGIDVNNGEHLMIADSPGQFAFAVRKMFNDSELRKAVIQNARKLIENKYSWEMIVGEMKQKYRKIGSSYFRNQRGEDV
jgi:glycosyltransferase involved in cell wall biosynthesis